MRRILAVLRCDYAHVAHNVIALLMCMGLAVMPSLYAWFNIMGSWDPYGNTGQLKVAVASADEGYEGTLVPISINVGDRVQVKLAKSDKADFVITDEDAAIEGVRSGEYYAAVIMPKSFSSDLLSAFSTSSSHPQLDYYVNEKRNPIASIVTGKVSGWVQSSVDQAFDEAVANVGAELLDEVSGVMDDESLASLAGSLAGVLDSSTRSVRQLSNDLGAYEGTIASMRALMGTATNLLEGNASSLEVSSLLDTATDGVARFDDAASRATDTASSALDQALAASDGIEERIDAAFLSADGQADRLEDALTRLGDEARTRRDALQQLSDRLDALDGDVYSLVRDVELDGTFATVDVEYAHQVRSDISDLKARVNAALGYVDDLIASYDRLVDDLAASRTDAETARRELKDLAGKARSEVDGLRGDFENELSGSMDRLAAAIGDAAADATRVSGTVRQLSSDLGPVTSRTSSDLTKLEESLGQASRRLADVADRLDGLRKRLVQASASGDMELVRTIVGSDPSGLADFLASPVETERVPLFAVDNNGSAMAPYYTTMALWVGGTLMGVLLYVGISEEAQRRCGAKPRHAYFGRLGFFLTIGAFQSTILLLGDLYFVGVQCAHPMLFMLTGWLASCVFINVIYALATSFGDVGKAVAVFLMVVQVAGSGGTFPVQMLPAPFKALYPFLPFVHSENAMRAAMFGVYDGDWAREMLMLASYLVPALLLGLLLRKPVVRLNEWMEEKLEETRLM